MQLLDDLNQGLADLAAQGLTRRRKTIETGVPQLLDFGVTHERAWEVGLACGGKVKVFVEKLS